MSELLVKPIVTEKMTMLGERLNRFAFVVDRRANKIQIRKAVQDMYGVTVTDVNTMVVARKAKQRFTRASVTKGSQSGYKKAIVTLAEGDTIDFYSNI